MKRPKDEFLVQRNVITVVSLGLEILAVCLLLKYAPQIIGQASSACKDLGVYDATSQNGFIAALIGAIAMLLVAWPITLVVTRRRARRKYEYERSTHTTRARFKREIDGIERLSRIAYEMKCHIEAQPSAITIKDAALTQAQWDKMTAKAVKALGESAPFLYYLDDQTHEACCGGLDCCSEKLGDGARERVNMFERAEELLEALQLQRRINASMDEESKKNDIDLDESYKAFVKCAWCRLHYIETGKDDRRRIEFVRSLFFHRMYGLLLNQFSHKQCPSSGKLPLL